MVNEELVFLKHKDEFRWYVSLCGCECVYQSKRRKLVEGNWHMESFKRIDAKFFLQM
jgi:hypothetical protein